MPGQRRPTAAPAFQGTRTCNRIGDRQRDKLECVSSALFGDWLERASVECLKLVAHADGKRILKLSPVTVFLLDDAFASEGIEAYFIA